jgi:2-C-methyl-D-erythritol 4-phosphate cytidylyltransferase
MIWGAVIVAAGRGTRFGRPKQLIEIAGTPMVAWSMRAFATMDEIAELVVVTEAPWIETMRELAAPLFGGRARAVAGGASRQESVYNGIAAVSERCDAVLVHDGARPLVRPADVRAAMAQVGERRGALLAAPVVDTIKVVEAGSLRVQRTLDRSALWSAQTPQLALRARLLEAHERARHAGFEATDDVALLEALGDDVVVVPASSENFKVTYPDDVARAEAVLRERAAERAR